MKAEDYINEVVGKPWAICAEGPDSFDCWGLVLDSFRRLDGVELPQVTRYTNEPDSKGASGALAIQSGSYIKCEPHDGAIMAAFLDGNFVHAGRCLCGGVVHATRGLSVRFDKYRVIKATNQHVEYFKYAPNTAS